VVNMYISGNRHELNLTLCMNQHGNGLVWQVVMKIRSDDIQGI
jgi:hypothetical protein